MAQSRLQTPEQFGGILLRVNTDGSRVFLRDVARVELGSETYTTYARYMNIVDEPVGVPDLFATIFAALGINPAKNLMNGERPVPITDKGTPIEKLFG